MSEIEVLQFSEPRLPRQGEYFQDEGAKIIKAIADYRETKYPIVTRTKIEIPEGARFFEWDE